MYAPFLCRPRKTVDLACKIASVPAGRGFSYRRDNVRESLRNLGDLLFVLDKDLTIELQHRRSDLYFVHAGVVAFRRAAVALVAPSGTGKSTTVWSLVCDGFGYVSDELMPLEVEAGRVLPYPRALCLKSVPSGAHALPAQTLHAGRLHYAPIYARASVQPLGSLPLRAVFFLERIEDDTKPEMGPVGVAEAAARLYANTLNALAHPGFGLDVATRIVRQVPCYRLRLGRPAATVAAVRTALSNGQRKSLVEAHVRL